MTTGNSIIIALAIAITLGGAMLIHDGIQLRSNYIEARKESCENTTDPKSCETMFDKAVCRASKRDPTTFYQKLTLSFATTCKDKDQ
jgi:hypothetical protein